MPRPRNGIVRKRRSATAKENGRCGFTQKGLELGYFIYGESE